MWARKLQERREERLIRANTRERVKELQADPTNMTMEEQATALLMKKSGCLEENEVPNVAVKTKFTTQFVQKLRDPIVGGFREMFGLDEGNDAEVFSAIAMEAEA